MQFYCNIHISPITNSPIIAKVWGRTKEICNNRAKFIIKASDMAIQKINEALKKRGHKITQLEAENATLKQQRDEAVRLLKSTRPYIGIGDPYGRSLDKAVDEFLIANDN